MWKGRREAEFNGKRFRVPGDMTEGAFIDMMTLWHSGRIQRCPYCGRLDIDPYSHWNKEGIQDHCNAGFQEWRRMEMEYEMGKD